MGSIDTGTNNTSASSTAWDCARLSVSSHGKKLWHDYLPSAIMLMGGCHEFYAAACEDGSVHLYSSTGRRYGLFHVMLEPPLLIHFFFLI